jgi:ribonuclease PH
MKNKCQMRPLSGSDDRAWKSVWYAFQRWSVRTRKRVTSNKQPATSNKQQATGNRQRATKICSSVKKNEKFLLD